VSIVRSVPWMRTGELGPFANISRLTLGGGGLGQGWGESSEEEAVATVHAAVTAGINLIDTAPMYGACEAVIASAFRGALPAGVRITTKCQLGTAPAGTVATMLEQSLDASLEAMELDHADTYFLHSNICEDDTVYAHGNDQRSSFATPWSQYVDEVVPAFVDLQRRGRIGAWGITGVGVPGTIIKALQHDVKPSVVQVITNLLDSPGGIRRFSEAPRPRAIIAAAQRNDVGVMGIRAVQAGALTAKFDRVVKASHPDAVDYQRAAPFRALCVELRTDPALLAHRYALDMDGVDTVVLGVKNRVELAQCLEAEALGALPPDLWARIDGLGLTNVGAAE
jgi:aryl-alcohol dehydrogenase-like predicted oxidoreductase